MQKIRVDLGDRSYNIHIGSGCLEAVGEILPRFGFGSRLAVVSNPTVYAIYGRPLRRSLRNAGFEAMKIIIPDGEKYKSLAWTQKIYEKLLRARLDRKSALLALGGGVIGDITGFAASTYMRGIDFVQVPTTLLAQVDSSVGGKTGVNHRLAKNMIGTFWQPRLVWIDVRTLRTLPRREFLAGLAEVIKYGVIHDAALFSFLEENRERILEMQDDALTHIIMRSCEIKAEVVSQDERESGIRAVLNYGHTIGHALETVTSYGKYLHGEAIAAGMCIEAKIAHLMGILDGAALKRIRSLIEAYELPASAPENDDFEGFLSTMQLDKKTVGGELTFILPEQIGTVRMQKGMPAEIIRRALQEL